MVGPVRVGAGPGRNQSGRQKRDGQVQSGAGGGSIKQWRAGADETGQVQVWRAGAIRPLAQRCGKKAKKTPTPDIGQKTVGYS